MADTEEPAEQEQHETTASTDLRLLESEAKSDDKSFRYSAPVGLGSSDNSVKRYGVVDFETFDSQHLDEFDPLKECDGNSSNETDAKSGYLLAVRDDKSLARHSAPGLLFVSQSEDVMENDLGASGFTCSFGSEDYMVGSGQREQRDFEHNGFDDDLGIGTKKGEKQCV